MDDQDQAQPFSSGPSTSRAQSQSREASVSRHTQSTRARAKGTSRALAHEVPSADALQPLRKPTHRLSASSPPQPIRFFEGAMVEQKQTSTGPARFLRVRRWLRSRTGRLVVPLLALLFGLIIGLTSILWYGLSGEGPLLILPSTARGNLIIEADQTLITQLVRKDLASAGLPGQVTNVRVDLEHGARMTIEGDDIYSVLGVGFSRHFTIDVQPYVRQCVLQIRVTNANLGGIPVTGFVQTFEGGINQQLTQKPGSLPDGFTYCTIGVRTQPGGMFITYQAVPITKG